MCPLFTYRRHGGGAVAGAVARLLAGGGDPLQSESLLLKKRLTWEMKRCNLFIGIGWGAIKKVSCAKLCRSSQGLYGLNSFFKLQHFFQEFVSTGHHWKRCKSLLILLACYQMIVPTLRAMFSCLIWLSCSLNFLISATADPISPLFVSTCKQFKLENTTLHRYI